MEWKEFPFTPVVEPIPSKYAKCAGYATLGGIVNRAIRIVGSLPALCIEK